MVMEGDTLEESIDIATIMEEISEDRNRLLIDNRKLIEKQRKAAKELERIAGDISQPKIKQILKLAKELSD